MRLHTGANHNKPHLHISSQAQTNVSRTHRGTLSAHPYLVAAVDVADFPEFIGKAHPVEVGRHVDEAPPLRPLSFALLGVVEKGVELLHLH